MEELVEKVYDTVCRLYNPIGIGALSSMIGEDDEDVRKACRSLQLKGKITISNMRVQAVVTQERKKELMDKIKSLSRNITATRLTVTRHQLNLRGLA